MRLAIFIPDSIYAAWSLTEGLAQTLHRMGHEMLVVRVPQTGRYDPKAFPEVEKLEECDGVILSGPEHIHPYLGKHYGARKWDSLKVPKAGWYHESNDRDDKHFGFETMRWTCNFHFFPASQDAEDLQGYWLPFGVDTQMFRPTREEKRYDTIFIGMVYPKRAEYLNQLAPHLGGNIRIGNCIVQDLSGVRLQESTELYARNVCQAKVFLNLPSLSRLTVTKVYEVAACGTLCLTPIPQGPSKNYQDVPALFYDSTDAAALGETLKYWLQEEQARITLSANLLNRTRSECSLEKRCLSLLERLQ